MALKKRVLSAVNHTMKGLKYLAALWTGISVYTVLSLLAGPVGLSAFRQLDAEREKQESNIRSLARTNRELSGERDALLQDPETIKSRARELGYGEADEQFVKIVGLRRPPGQRREAGQAAAVRFPGSLPDETIRLIALLAGGIALAFILFCGFLRMLPSGGSRRGASPVL